LNVPIGRRKLLVAGAAGGLVIAGGSLSRTSDRMPVVYLPHGGGPWPFVDMGGFMDPREHRALAGYLSGLAGQLPRRPTAVVAISAHWEAPVPTVMTSAKPPMFYDYYGFPPESYTISWPAPGEPALAARVRALLGSAGIQTAEDPARGFDHGTFVPLKLTFPDADVPTIQLSLQAGLDPARHLAIGRALAPLRDEGVLLVGSGMSFHNLREYRSPRTPLVAATFDAWLQQAILADPAERDAALTQWATAPSARQAHPREEHLLPLMVIAGAAGADRGTVAFSGTVGGARVSAAHCGA
jgi:aromatic ring-opening dioxygenase catalytic subunit (LigB family)